MVSGTVPDGLTPSIVVLSTTVSPCSCLPFEADSVAVPFTASPDLPDVAPSAGISIVCEPTAGIWVVAAGLACGSSGAAGGTTTSGASGSGLGAVMALASAFGRADDAEARPYRATTAPSTEACTASRCATA